MALYCFDGTSEHGVGHHGGTNVLRFARVYDGQYFYFGGVGNPVETDGLGRVIGLAFGYGGQEILSRALETFQQQAAQDPVIDIIAFSRGAAIAIEFVHRALSWAQTQPLAIELRFIGLMDTVFSFGLPNDIDLHYHHALPETQAIKAVYHAVALHETRAWFPVTCQPALDNVEDFQELGFKGAHADVGGGYRDRSLSNIVLNWLVEGAKKHGVSFNQQLPDGRPYTVAEQQKVPVTHEYFKSDPDRLPFRENQWYFAQAPRRLDRHIVDDAANRGLDLCDWQRRTVKDYRMKPHPRVFTYIINLSRYQKQNGKIVDPTKEFKLYKRYRGNGRPILIAEHEPLSLEEKINYNVPPPLTAPRKSKWKRFR